MRILVVDDEELIGRTIQRALPEHEIDAAMSGAEGLAMHVARPYPFALLDSRLPDMLGAELGRRMMQHRALLLVYMSGAEMADTKLAVETLDKPFSMAQLRELLVRLDLVEL